METEGTSQTLSTYELTNSATVLGTIIVGAMALGGVVLTARSVISGQFASAAIGIGLTGALLILAVKSYKNLERQITYILRSDALVVVEPSSEKELPLTGLARVKLTAWGAGESSKGSFKLEFASGDTVWLHADGRAGEFAKEIARAAGVQPE